MRLASQFFGRLEATQHISANHQIEIDGNRATCMSTLFAQHFANVPTGPPIQRQVGYYINELDRLDDWRIVRSEHRVAWTEGNEAVFAHATSGLA